MTGRDRRGAQSRRGVPDPVPAIDHVAITDVLNVTMKGAFTMANVYGDAQVFGRYPRVRPTRIDLLHGLSPLGWPAAATDVAGRA